MITILLIGVALLALDLVQENQITGGVLTRPISIAYSLLGVTALAMMVAHFKWPDLELVPFLLVELCVIMMLQRERLRWMRSQCGVLS